MDKTEQLLVAPAVAQMHIQDITRDPNNPFRYSVAFEFQCRLDNKYVWLSVIEFVDIAPRSSLLADAQIAEHVYYTVKRMRETIEGDDPGRYIYILDK